MKFLFLLLLIPLCARADTPITGLPLGNAATTGTSDVLPYVDVGTSTTKKLRLWDLINLPPFGGGGSGTTYTIGTINAQPKSANGLVIVASVLYAQTADAFSPGMVSTAAQTFAGAKTFSSTILGNISGNAGTATALSANPTDCTPGQFANAIDAQGNLTCAAAGAGDVVGPAGATDNALPLFNGITGKLIKNSILTVSGSVITASVSGSAMYAKQLMATPTGCSVGQFATSIDALGNLSCGTPTGTGDVTGPAGATDNAIPLFNGATGKVIKNSILTVSGSVIVASISGSAMYAKQLMATPTGCSAGQFASSIDALGNLSCGTPAGAGDVTGPASSTDNAITLFNGTSGKIVKDSILTVAGSVITASISGSSMYAKQFISNPTDCGGGQFANAIDQFGNLTCASAGTGDVVGPGSATDSAVALFDTTTGKLLKNSSVTVAGSTMTASISGLATYATQLAANPTDCGANNFATAIDAQGNLTCAVPGSGTYVVGPGSATDNAIALFNGITGKIIKDSILTVSGSVITASISGSSMYAKQFITNPTDCGVGDFANAIDQFGNLTCATPGGGGGGGTLNAKFTLDGETVVFTDIGGPHYQTATQTLSAVNISMLNSGTSGSTTIRVNQYRSGALQNSATASLSASSGNPAGTIAALSGNLSLLAGDIITVDVTAVATGTPGSLTVEY